MGPQGKIPSIHHFLIFWDSSPSELHVPNWYFFLSNLPFEPRPDIRGAGRTLGLGQAVRWSGAQYCRLKFLAEPDQCRIFGTFIKPNWIIMMYKNFIVEIMPVHQNYPIWVIKNVRNDTFSLWACQKLSTKSLLLVKDSLENNHHRPWGNLNLFLKPHSFTTCNS